MRTSTLQYSLGVIFTSGFLAAITGLFVSPADKAVFVTVIGFMTGGLVLVAVLPRLNEFSIGSSFTAKLARVEDKVDKVKEEVDITKQFLMSMSKPMYDNLRKIASGDFGLYEMPRASGLQRELYHLRDIGYIDAPSIRGIPGNGNNLSDYVKITPIGQKFVNLGSLTSVKIEIGLHMSRCFRLPLSSVLFWPVESGSRTTALGQKRFLN